MQNTTLGEVIKELQQQYEVVGNIPVKLLENDLSLVLVYDEQPLKKEQMYIAMAVFTAGIPWYIVPVDSRGNSVQMFSNKLEAQSHAIKLPASEIYDLINELTQNMYVSYKFDIMRVNYD